MYNGREHDTLLLLSDTSVFKICDSVTVTSPHSNREIHRISLALELAVGHVLMKEQ